MTSKSKMKLLIERKSFSQHDRKIEILYTLYTVDSTLQVAVTKNTPLLIKNCFINLSIIQDGREGLTHLRVVLTAQ
jgi:hypothetical protein